MTTILANAYDMRYLLILGRKLELNVWVIFGRITMNE